MFDFTGTYTDFYQLTMAQAYFLKNHTNQVAVFDYFFRKLPFNGGYAIFAGLDNLLDELENLQFNQEDIEFLQVQGFNPQFLDYLKHFRFQGSIYAANEGDVIFPGRPIVSVEATIIEAQIIETILLNILNFQTLIATKARRIRHIAPKHRLVDFGLRRAQGPGGYYASRAAIIGGFNATSNVRAGRDFAIPLAGTMAHSFVQSYGDELLAFREFAKSWPDKCVLLVDTYNTLESGLPNAIKVAHELAKQGHRLQGIRIDSGDLAYLAKEARRMLDAAQLQDVKITVSNQLNEDVIQSLLAQNAPIDTFGVGTNLVIGFPDAILDGVYKLVLIDDKPCMKLSETPAKITTPFKKQVYRVLDDNKNFLGIDIVALAEEKKATIPAVMVGNKLVTIDNYDKEPILQLVMKNGKRLFPVKNLNELAQYSQERLDKLPMEYKRFVNPGIYRIELSNELRQQRDKLAKQVG